MYSSVNTAVRVLDAVALSRCIATLVKSLKDDESLTRVVFCRMPLPSRDAVEVKFCEATCFLVASEPLKPLTEIVQVLVKEATVVSS